MTTAATQLSPVVAIFRQLTCVIELVIPVMFDPVASMETAYSCYRLMTEVYGLALHRINQMTDVTDANRQTARAGLRDLAEELEQQFIVLRARRGQSHAD